MAIGKTSASYLIELNSDSAGKPGVGGLWTVTSDERIKSDIILADLDRCVEIVESVPLKYFTWADGVYTEEQVSDRHCLGWTAQDVQKIFPKSVNTIEFVKKIENGEEEKTISQFDENTGELVEKVISATKYKEESIKDCMAMNASQLMAAHYGATQQLIKRVKELEAIVAKITGGKDG